ncbi:cbb3-type cytochrome c oxidase subunit I [Vibrio anguillarum]|uniref:cbb3-type cytochrome c oxidase subunit I n=1 Tax=Vibrio anguillarum TaxID=55601 RepID=UPI0039C4DA81
MMYYFVPKQAERPVYSYRLSIVSLLGFDLSFIWAGPHHLHYTALPDWTQSTWHGDVVSVVCSFMGRDDQRDHDVIWCLA